ncbi:MAG: hypothetical protein JXM70_20455 [Pirellulales bacterium]|nr:hypothetical protein [Pirellulales bacterium]
MKSVAFTHPNDVRTGAVRFVFKDGVDLDSVDQLLSELPDGYTISFFNADFPQWSDPGAYFDILRYKSDLYIKAGNHGWMTEFKKESVEVLKRLIWACIEFNANEDNHFTYEKHLYAVTTCRSFGGGFNKAYIERLGKLES